MEGSAFALATPVEQLKLGAYPNLPAQQGGHMDKGLNRNDARQPLLATVYTFE
jgi:hypothetical protein